MLFTLLLSVLMLSACSSDPVMTLDISEDGSSCSVSLSRAPKGTFASAGVFTVHEGDHVVIDHRMNEKGSISVKFIPSDDLDALGQGASAGELQEAINQENARLEAILIGTGTDIFELAPGSYQISVTVEVRADGDVAIAAEST